MRAQTLHERPFKDTRDWTMYLDSSASVHDHLVHNYRLSTLICSYASDLLNITDRRVIRRFGNLNLQLGFHRGVTGQK